MEPMGKHYLTLLRTMENPECILAFPSLGIQYKFAYNTYMLPPPQRSMLLRVDSTVSRFGRRRGLWLH